MLFYTEIVPAYSNSDCFLAVVFISCTFVSLNGNTHAMTRKTKENLVYKHALTLTLEMLLHDTGEIYFDGYDNDADRLEFQCDGHRCRLLEINDANYLEHGGYITLTTL